MTEYFEAPQNSYPPPEKLEKSLDLKGSSINFTIVLTYHDGVVLRVP